MRVDQKPHLHIVPAKTETLRVSQTDLMERNEFIQQVIPLLYNYPQGIPKSQWRGSYGAKHDVEHAFGLYISNSEFIKAAVEMGIQHEAGDPNYRFGMKPRFPMSWFQPHGRRMTLRPRGEQMKKWNAYLDACKEIDELKSNIETMIDAEQDRIRETHDADQDQPIMKLKTQDEKVRYALQA